MTQKELERFKMENDPTYVPEKERIKALTQKTEQEQDEESMMHWIWNKINPHYKTYVGKREFLNFLLSDKDVRDVFNLRENELVHIIESLFTERPECLKFEEFEVKVSKSVFHGRKPQKTVRPRKTGRPKPSGR